MTGGHFPSAEKIHEMKDVGKLQDSFNCSFKFKQTIELNPAKISLIAQDLDTNRSLLAETRDNQE